MVEIRNAYKILIGKSEGKGPLGRLRRRVDDGITLGLKGVVLGNVEWIHLAQDRVKWQALVNTVMNFRVQFKAGNFWTSQETIRLSRRTLPHGDTYLTCILRA
jgi:hypothetical protein